GCGTGGSEEHRRQRLLAWPRRARDAAPAFLELDLHRTDRLGEVLGARRGALALAPRDAARDLAPSAGGLRRARHDVDQVGEVWNQPFLAAIRKIVVETLAQARVHAVDQPAAGGDVA